jgi:hypothetical protein
VGRRAETGIGSEWSIGSFEINGYNDADTGEAEGICPASFLLGAGRAPTFSSLFMRVRVICRVAKVA